MKVFMLYVVSKKTSHSFAIHVWCDSVFLSYCPPFFLSTRLLLLFLLIVSSIYQLYLNCVIVQLEMEGKVTVFFFSLLFLYINYSRFSLIDSMFDIDLIESVFSKINGRLLFDRWDRRLSFLDIPQIEMTLDAFSWSIEH